MSSDSLEPREIIKCIICSSDMKNFNFDNRCAKCKKIKVTAKFFDVYRKKYVYYFEYEKYTISSYDQKSMIWITGKYSWNTFNFEYYCGEDKFIETIKDFLLF